jgi:hypothetical protein
VFGLLAPVVKDGHIRTRQLHHDEVASRSLGIKLR